MGTFYLEHLRDQIDRSRLAKRFPFRLRRAPGVVSKQSSRRSLNGPSAVHLRSPPHPSDPTFASARRQLTRTRPAQLLRLFSPPIFPFRIRARSPSSCRTTHTGMATLGNDPPPLTHVGRDTALLLGPQTIAWQISFFLFGIYLALLSKTVRDPVFSKFAPAVKMVNWVVFVLVLAYNGQSRKAFSRRRVPETRAEISPCRLQCQSWRS